MTTLQERAEQLTEAVARQGAIVALRRSGKTLQEIGDRYGITRERVRQILAAALREKRTP